MRECNYKELGPFVPSLSLSTNLAKKLRQPRKPNYMRVYAGESTHLCSSPRGCFIFFLTRVVVMAIIAVTHRSAYLVLSESRQLSGVVFGGLPLHDMHTAHWSTMVTLLMISSPPCPWIRPPCPWIGTPLSVHCGSLPPCADMQRMYAVRPGRTICCWGSAPMLGLMSKEPEKNIHNSPLKFVHFGRSFTAMV